MVVRNINTGKTWIRSSRCGPKHNCVELRHADARVIIRDSKGGAATILVFGRAPWSTFVEGCRSEF